MAVKPATQLSTQQIVVHTQHTDNLSLVLHKSVHLLVRSIDLMQLLIDLQNIFFPSSKICTSLNNN